MKWTRVDATKTAEKQLHDKGVSYEQISVVLGRQSGKLHKGLIYNYIMQHQKAITKYTKTGVLKVYR